MDNIRGTTEILGDFSLPQKWPQQGPKFAAITFLVLFGLQ